MRMNTTINQRSAPGRRSIRLTRGDRVFMALDYAILGLFGLLVLYPIIYVLSSSFSDPKRIMEGRVWLLPVDFTFKGYEAAFQYSWIWSGFGNSVLYALCGTLLGLVMTTMCAYPLSRRDLRGHAAIMFFMSFTLWFSGGMIPTYLQVRNLGLLNHRTAMLIPSAMSVYNMIIMRTYIQNSIPYDLFESARLDGCNDLQYLFHIVIPLSKPVLAVLALYYAVWYWNTYFYAFLYLSDRHHFPLQLILREIIQLNKAEDMLNNTNLADIEDRLYMSELLKYTSIVISTLPAIIVYPFVQKHFVKGIMIGAIKG